ncbi:hypothetical protein [Nocardioides speluncae]|uniref:hypothetical protein n=1 Tax=Nocardioides speluncae TaxID=2670337 RepID=UPI001F0C17D9|nr:hypothetical protein [Nocardioides speluncae]
MKALLTAVLAAGFLTVPVQALAAPDPLTVADQSAAMQRDFGLTEQQMQARLAAETSAAKLLPSARKAAGAAFGGAWYDAATQKLVVGVVGAARTDAVRATGARVTAVPVSAKALNQRKAAVDKLAGKAVPRAVSGWAADPRTGKS